MNVIAKISFVIPAFNEADNIRPLFTEVAAVADGLGLPYEVIFIDDCSNDGTLQEITGLVREFPAVRALSFPVNRGQSAALGAGFRMAGGDVVITMDADLQNDPRDVPRMLELYRDHDMVTGWRVQRSDTFSRRVASRIGNGVRNLLTHETVHDTGCSLKVMRADLVKRIKMYRGLHRFLPTLMRLEGATVIETPVNHRPRVHGVSKYTNLRRGIEGLYDLVAVRWMMRRHLNLEGGHDVR